MCPSESSAGGRRLKLIALDLVSSVIAVSWDCKPRDFAREATDAGMRAPQGPRGGQASFLEYPKSSQSPALQGVEYEREAPARVVPTLARASGLYSDDRDGAKYKPDARARGTNSGAAVRRPRCQHPRWRFGLVFRRVGSRCDSAAHASVFRGTGENNALARDHRMYECATLPCQGDPVPRPNHADVDTRLFNIIFMCVAVAETASLRPCGRAATRGRTARGTRGRP